jgi:hypothetical protein
MKGDPAVGAFDDLDRFNRAFLAITWFEIVSETRFASPSWSKTRDAPLDETMPANRALLSRNRVSFDVVLLIVGLPLLVERLDYLLGGHSLFGEDCRYLVAHLGD